MKKVRFLLMGIVIISTGKVSAQPVTANWEAQYSISTSAPDEAGEIIADDWGNIYITGTTHLDYYYGNHGDITTIRYNGAGVKEWVATYDGPDKKSDFARDMVMDKDDNLYVTGYSTNSFGGHNFVTIKFNNAGQQQWVAVYEDSMGVFVVPAKLSIVIDDSSNVYISGTVYDSALIKNIVTIKYNTDGEQKWLASPLTNAEFTEMDIDAEANLYLTAWGWTGSQTEFITIKLNSNSILQWVAYYHKLGSANNVVSDIAVDSEGNSYLSGTAVEWGGSETCVTVKYNTNGVEQWVSLYSGSTYNSGGEIEIDTNGNVYVVGGSATATVVNCLILKYRNSGEELWHNLYGLYGYSTGARDITVDETSGVYITTGDFNSINDIGTNDIITFNYDSSGTFQWASIYNGIGNKDDGANAIYRDANGKIYVTGFTWSSNGSNDFVTIKYDSSGVAQWSAIHNTKVNGNNQVTALALDHVGNIYVTGQGDDSTSVNNFKTIKYDPNGVQQWVADYHDVPAVDGIQQAKAMALDDNGNVYVTGRSEDSTGTCNYATIKYNNNGVQQWVASYNGSGNADDVANALTVDALQNVYVTGYSPDSNGTNKYLTIKYNSEGELQWLANYSGSFAGEHIYANAIGLDNAGNVLVTGFGINKYYTIKYNSSGIQQWVGAYILSLSYAPHNAMAVDNAGNVYVTGWENFGLADSFVTIKYNTDGMQEWAVYSDDGRARDVAVDGKGNVYVTGGGGGSGSSDPGCRTIKYDSSGVQQWIASYHDSSDAWDAAIALTLDIFGNVYVAGSYFTNDGKSGYLTIKYDTTGILQWVIKTDSTAYSTPSGIAVNNSGNIYVAGSITYDNVSYNYLIVKYTDGVTGIETTPLNQDTMLLYPNPFYHSIFINYSISKNSTVSLEVFNLLGQKVKSILQNEKQADDLHQYEFIGTGEGIYCVKLTVDGISSSQKIIQVK